MADEKTVVQAELQLGVDQFKRDLDESVAAAQQAVERMNTIGAGAPLPVPGIPSPGPSPMPSSPPPASTPTPGGGGAGNPIAAAWEEIGKIRAMAQTAPDVAMAAIQGNGGLQSRLLKGGVANPEQAGEYQELVNALKELTGSLKATGEESPISSILKFVRGNALMGAVSTVGSNVMSGNVLGAGGAAIGGALGLFGGPLGAQAGAQVGQMVGNGVGAFLDKTGEAREYAKLTADIAGRFGDFGQESGLKPDAMNEMKTSGYDNAETARLFDSLRQNRVISSVDAESTKLVEELQALTRATGINTDALVQSYSAYRNQGGEGSANEYMAQMISGAVGAGMKENLQQYQELVGSARMQLVYGSAQADTGDGALKKIQATLSNVMGGEGETSKLMRDNPMLMQQMLSGYLSTGSAKAYSGDAAMMQLAGIDRSKVDEVFMDPAQKPENAAIRSKAFLNNALPGLSKVTGMSTEQMMEAAKADPDFLNKLSSSSNPNSAVAGAVQDHLRTSFQSQYMRMPTPEEMQMQLKIGNNALANNGQIDLNAPTADGGTLGKQLEESMKTDAQKARDAEAELKQEQMKFFEKFAGLLTVIADVSKELLEGVNAITGFLNPNKDKAPTTTVQTGTGQIDSAATLSQISTDGLFGMPTAGKDPLLGVIGGGFKPDVNVPDFFGGGGPAVKLNAPTLGGGGMGGAPAPKVDFKFNTPHAKVNDTPTGGLLASHGFNVFEFAPGDLVQASQGGGSQQGQGGSPISLSFNMSFVVGEGGDRSAIAAAAKQGANAGFDEFLQAWESGPLQPKNQPRINGRLY
jgi:hypothetical protein